jgi:uncharacterized coiled-coil protein SlyX
MASTCSKCHIMAVDDDAKVTCPQVCSWVVDAAAIQNTQLQTRITELEGQLVSVLDTDAAAIQNTQLQTRITELEGQLANALTINDDLGVAIARRDQTIARQDRTIVASLRRYNQLSSMYEERITKLTKNSRKSMSSITRVHNEEMKNALANQQYCYVYGVLQLPQPPQPPQTPQPPPPYCDADHEEYL